MNATAFRAALRIARRDALRAKWRSLLVIALIGLPVFVLAATDIVYRTYQLSPREQITREIGAADAAIEAFGVRVTQGPKAWLAGMAFEGAEPQDAPPAERMRAALPAGSRVIESVYSTSGLQIRTRIGIEVGSLVGLDYADPIAAGMVRQLSGRAPRNDHEVAPSKRLAASLGLHLGDTLHTAKPDRDYTVVGIVENASHHRERAAYVLPSVVHGLPDSGNDVSTWLVDTPAPVTWADVRALNAIGFAVLSRHVFLDPPPKSQIPALGTDVLSSRISAAAVTTITLVAGMALLEVVLLAGPAFAVSARRQRHDLALIAAVGGRRADLRNVVLANGIVLGLAAGVVAAAAAVAATAVAIPTLGGLVDQVPGHFDVRPLELGGLTVVSLLTALLAAAFPARAAARTDVTAALAGRRGTVRSRKRVPVTGAALAGVGVVVALGAVTASKSANIILTGVVLTELGLIMCTPALLGGFARLGRWLPLAPRIALRDAGRNRSSASPAVAAVMASMIGAVAVAVAVASKTDQDRRSYHPSLPRNAAFVALDAVTADNRPADPKAVAAALAATLPTKRVLPVMMAGNPCVPAANGTPTCTQVSVDLSFQERAGLGRYYGGLLPEVVVDDGSGVDALLGEHVPEAIAALRSGRAVATDSNPVHNGSLRLLVMTDAGGPVSSPDGAPVPVPEPKPVDVPATVVERGFAASRVIIPPSMAARAGGSATVGVLAALSRTPTDHELQAARGALSKVNPILGLTRETGYQNPQWWLLYGLVGAAAIIALGAASIATTLANVDGRGDLVTLGAVGANPRTRRVMSMSRAGVIAGIGCVLGVAAGFVPAVAWVRATRVPISVHSGVGYVSGGVGYVSVGESLAGPQLHLVVPWSAIGLALVGVPLVAALAAGLFTRSRLPSERPAE